MMTPATPATYAAGQAVTVTDPRNAQATCAGTVLATDARGAVTVRLTRSRLHDAAPGDVAAFHPRDWRIAAT
jgi:hypothetical protein